MRKQSFSGVRPQKLFLQVCHMTSLFNSPSNLHFFLSSMVFSLITKQCCYTYVHTFSTADFTTKIEIMNLPIMSLFKIR